MSIQANELRIGNFVEYDGRIFQIDTISNEFPTLNTDEFGIGVVDWNNIQPIPLTEELLLKFGFFKYQWMNGYFINTIFGDLMIQFYKTEIHLFFTKVSYDSQGMKFYGRKFINNKTNFTDCKYVHQLQNLYFALTGEELTFKK
jgi:hypothetical protein